MKVRTSFLIALALAAVALIIVYTLELGQVFASSTPNA